MKTTRTLVDQFDVIGLPTVGTRAPWHIETGKGTASNGIRFQLRPDPLSQ